MSPGGEMRHYAASSQISHELMEFPELQLADYREPDNQGIGVKNAPHYGGPGFPHIHQGNSEMAALPEEVGGYITYAEIILIEVRNETNLLTRH